MSGVRLSGRVLYLTEDAELLRAQLAGVRLEFDAQLPLLANVSTEELTPAWACYYYDRTLARYCLVGLRGNGVARDEIRDGGFQVIVSGPSKGCGSSRETAPYAELACGVRVVFAPSFEKIYLQNCQNIGLLTSTDFSLLERLERGEELPVSAFSGNLSPISRAIVEAGGLFAYNRARSSGAARPDLPSRAPRPMTLAEKVLAHKLLPGQGEFVKPGDAVLVRVDAGYSHEFTTAQVDWFLAQEYGAQALVGFYRSVDRGASTQQAFRALGTSEREFVAAWRADLARLAGVAG
jgi:3-isopropylmalate/(R)-2-methylmalate dehydratase large subunit